MGEGVLSIRLLLPVHFRIAQHGRFGRFSTSGVVADTGTKRADSVNALFAVMCSLQNLRVSCTCLYIFKYIVSVVELCNVVFQIAILKPLGCPTNNTRNHRRFLCSNLQIFSYSTIWTVSNLEALSESVWEERCSWAVCQLSALMIQVALMLSRSQFSHFWN